MKTILYVVGARPNFMKAAPIIEAGRAHSGFRQVLINTGQHYDDAMARRFFIELNLPTPDRDLGVGSATHAVQTANIMTRFEEVCVTERPDVVVVFGDINSTMAATLVAAKMEIPVAHVEAGLRSFDRSMPEEINRIVTDRLARLLLTPSQDADENLLAEGVPADRIRLVGNVMIDTLFKHLPLATVDRARGVAAIGGGPYAVVTLHRPSNVDRRETFAGVLDAIGTIAGRMPVVFSVHPRTQARLREFNLLPSTAGIIMTEPMGYIDFLSLTANACVVLTDSGGIQEETTALGIPCLTLRENTERPITVTQGTNRVVGTSGPDILRAFDEAVEQPPLSRRPELWDGHTAERIARVMGEFLGVAD
jgi:UDP-N-acetylglucosamine 2-epimerase (non-hydrolysing)